MMEVWIRADSGLSLEFALEEVGYFCWGEWRVASIVHWEVKGKHVVNKGIDKQVPSIGV